MLWIIVSLLTPFEQHVINTYHFINSKHFTKFTEG